jgi:hypothetical protein
VDLLAAALVRILLDYGRLGGDDGRVADASGTGRDENRPGSAGHQLGVVEVKVVMVEVVSVLLLVQVVVVVVEVVGKEGTRRRRGRWVVAGRAAAGG